MHEKEINSFEDAISEERHLLDTKRVNRVKYILVLRYNSTDTISFRTNLTIHEAE